MLIHDNFNRILENTAIMLMIMIIMMTMITSIVVGHHHHYLVKMSKKFHHSIHSFIHWSTNIFLVILNFISIRNKCRYNVVYDRMVKIRRPFSQLMWIKTQTVINYFFFSFIFVSSVFCVCVCVCVRMNARQFIAFRFLDSYSSLLVIFFFFFFFDHVHLLCIYMIK